MAHVTWAYSYSTPRSDQEYLLSLYYIPLFPFCFGTAIGRDCNPNSETLRAVSSVLFGVLAEYLSRCNRLVSLRHISSVSNRDLLSHHTNFSLYKNGFSPSSTALIAAAWLFLYVQRLQRPSHSAHLFSGRHCTF